MPALNLRQYPNIKSDKLKELDQFLTTWDPTEGWPAAAPLTVPERDAVSVALWDESEITWLRVLGSVLNPATEKLYREVSVVNHFNVFPQDVERMFAYWMRSRHLKDYGLPLLQTYFAVRNSSFYPALAGVVPLAETVMKREGYQRGFSADYKKFFLDHDATGIGTRLASVFVEMLYEKDPVGGFDNRERFNRHKLAHGISPQAVTSLDVLSGCLILDMIVSTVETNGQLFTRILRQ
jgi:hypothetical protein